MTKEPTLKPIPPITSFQVEASKHFSSFQILLPLHTVTSLYSNLNLLSEAEYIPSTNVASGVFATLARITVPVNGYYLLDADLSFDPGTGIRILMVDVLETDANSAINSVLAEGRATMQKIRMLGLTTTDTIYIRAYQNTGSTMSIVGSYRLLRLR